MLSEFRKRAASGESTFSQNFATEVPQELCQQAASGETIFSQNFATEVPQELCQQAAIVVSQHSLRRY
jgi:hypothetical protein